MTIKEYIEELETQDKEIKFLLDEKYHLLSFQDKFTRYPAIEKPLVDTLVNLQTKIGEQVRKRESVLNEFSKMLFDHGLFVEREGDDGEYEYIVRKLRGE